MIWKGAFVLDEFLNMYEDVWFDWGFSHPMSIDVVLFLGMLLSTYQDY